jgi:cell division protein FtsW (lipid II flippase)
MILVVRLKLDLEIIRRYKYILLSLGLFLTALTIIFGTNPEGVGPRLWLGCCGIYLQPSEPLKLFLIGYLSAYLADRLPARNRLIPLLFPTLVVTGLALLLLLFQRDLGTASIFILLYASIVYIGTGHRRVLVISSMFLVVAGLVGYYLIDLIQLRIESWLNPWLDPSGRSYQIIQSLLAVANGGLLGRGPGLGSPALVPIAHSDFIFTAIAEELGLFGVIGVLLLLALLISRGVHIAILATGRFQRMLAIGITAYFSIQSLLIIGGNLRVLPLTGVTLPFVSYGGSSLLTGFIATLVLLLISTHRDDEPAPLPNPSPYFLLDGLVGLGLIVMAVGAGWWILARGPDLLTRTDNARRSISDRFVKRGDLVDRNNLPIDLTIGTSGEYTRIYAYPSLGSVTGYTHPVYGQAGLEASLDEYLRGLQGNPASLIWWDRLLYGTPPPGVDIRLSIDLSLQTQADALLGDRTGAILILNSSSGEVLVMASHPGYDPNLLDDQVELLVNDLQSPLINRVTQGQYPPSSALEPFSEILLGKPTPGSSQELTKLADQLGFTETPLIRAPGLEAREPQREVRVSPLQMGLAAAGLSGNGVIPAPRLALAANTPQEGWVILPALGTSKQILPEIKANEAIAALAGNATYWEFTGVDNEAKLTWNLSGTLPGWKGTPMVITIALEEINPELARLISDKLLNYAANP